MLTRSLIAVFILLLSLSAQAPVYGEAATGKQDQQITGGEQSRTIDSLKLVIATAEHDTVKINGLLKLGEVLIVPNPDTVLIIEKEVQELAEENLESDLHQGE